MLDTVYIGATAQMATDGLDFYSDPRERVSKQWKDPNKIAGRIQEIQDERQLEAGTMSMVGTLTSAFVIDKNGNTVFDIKSRSPGQRCSVAMPFLQWFMQEFGEQFADSLRFGETTPQATIFGLRLKQYLKVAAFEVFGQNINKSDAEQVHIPVRLWHNPVGVYDPAEVMLTGPERKDLDLIALMQYMRTTLPNGKPSTSLLDLEADAQAQAFVTKQLVERGQLVTMLVPANI
jgi:hypothetical protein